MRAVVIAAVSIGFACCAHSALVAAAEQVVEQKDKQFSVRQLNVKVGDRVSFKNADPFFHNVFSLSDTKTFDLGSYPQGQAKSVSFDKPGTVEIECAVHPGMKMTIKVAK